MTGTRLEGYEGDAAFSPEGEHRFWHLPAQESVPGAASSYPKNAFSVASHAGRTISPLRRTLASLILVACPASKRTVLMSAPPGIAAV